MWEWLNQARIWRIWLGIIVLFIASMVQSCSELKHSLWGVTTTATVLSVEPSQYEKNNLYLNMRFVDENGKQQFVKRTVGPRVGPIAPNDEVEVIYVGSPEKARLVAERTWFWPIVFFIMVGTVLIWSFVSYRRLDAGKF